MALGQLRNHEYKTLLLILINLSMTGFKSIAVQVTVLDIDSATETEMLINAKKVNPPIEILADLAPKTVAIGPEKGVHGERYCSEQYLFGRCRDAF